MLVSDQKCVEKFSPQLMKGSSNVRVQASTHDNCPTTQKCKAYYYIPILTFIRKELADSKMAARGRKQKASLL
jgi:hypothetical protein